MSLGQALTMLAMCASTFAVGLNTFATTLVNKECMPADANVDVDDADTDADDSMSAAAERISSRTLIKILPR